MEFESPRKEEESLMLWKTKSGHVSCLLFKTKWRKYMVVIFKKQNSWGNCNLDTRKASFFHQRESRFKEWEFKMSFNCKTSARPLPQPGYCKHSYSPTHTVIHCVFIHSVLNCFLSLSFDSFLWRFHIETFRQHVFNIQLIFLNPFLQYNL